MLKTLKTLNRRRKMTKWCQNPKCPDRKSSGQIRGNKGNKWYQSSSVNSYGYGGGNFCTLHCHNEWSEKYMSQAIDALNLRIHEPVKIYLEDSWFVKYDYSWSSGQISGSYKLVNKLKGITHIITKEQAQTPEQQAEEYGDWRTIDDTQARELAIQLGLAS